MKRIIIVTLLLLGGIPMLSIAEDKMTTGDNKSDGDKVSAEGAPEIIPIFTMAKEEEVEKE